MVEEDERREEEEEEEKRKGVSLTKMFERRWKEWMDGK